MQASPLSDLKLIKPPPIPKPPHPMPMPRGAFFVVREGNAVISISGQPHLYMTAGDMIFLLKGQGHSISDHPDSPLTPIFQLIPLPPQSKNLSIKHGGGGEMTRLLCNVFTSVSDFVWEGCDIVQQVMFTSFLFF